MSRSSNKFSKSHLSSLKDTTIVNEFLENVTQNTFFFTSSTKPLQINFFGNSRSVWTSRRSQHIPLCPRYLRSEVNPTVFLPIMNFF